MPLDPCPRCGIAVLTMKIEHRDMGLEPQIDLDADSPEVLRWIPHSKDRCAFARLIDSNFS